MASNAEPLSILRLQEDAEMCAKYAAALADYGNDRAARSYSAAADKLWQRWVDAVEQSDACQHSAKERRSAGGEAR